MYFFVVDTKLIKLKFIPNDVNNQKIFWFAERLPEYMLIGWVQRK